MKMVDDKLLSFRPAVEISNLDKKSQSNVEYFINMGHKISLKHATSLRKKAESVGLTTNDVAILLPEKKENIRKIEVPFSQIKEYFNDDISDKEIIEKIIQLLKLQN